MKAHPAAELFPLINKAELAELAADIKAHGLQNPIVTLDGAILDGRNRFEACKLAGVTPKLEPWKPLNGESPTQFVLSTNLHRRHLTDSQRTMIAVDAVKLLETERPKGRPSKEAPTGAPKGKTAAIVAGTMKVKTRSVERAKALKRDAPDLAKKVMAGELSLNQASKQVKRAAQVAAVKKYRPPSGTYAVVVADPPWSYDKRKGDATQRGQTPYPTQTVEQICKQKPKLAKDAVLWLWTTNAHLLDGSAAKVLKAWGVEPKTMLTWAKPKMGTGDWLRGQTEHCILAVKGKPVVNLTNQTTLLSGEVREHSRKPEEFYRLAEKLCPAEPKLELNARTEHKGWVGFGPEAVDLAKTIMGRFKMRRSMARCSGPEIRRAP